MIFLEGFIRWFGFRGRAVVVLREIIFVGDLYLLFSLLTEFHATHSPFFHSISIIIFLNSSSVHFLPQTTVLPLPFSIPLPLSILIPLPLHSLNQSPQFLPNSDHFLLLTLYPLLLSILLHLYPPVLLLFLLYFISIIEVQPKSFLSLFLTDLCLSLMGPPLFIRWLLTITLLSSCP